jgi:hypothetical protein
MAFGQDLKSSLGSKTINALSSVSSSVLRDLFNGKTKIKDILYKYKEKVGTGFRKNLWTVDFFFRQNMLDDVGHYTFLTESTYNQKRDDNILSSDLLSTRDFFHPKSSNIFMLANAFNVPGVKLNQNDITKYIKYVNGSERSGMLTCDMIMDQWGDSYNFWSFYMNKITNGEIVFIYPDEYMFDIEIKLLTTQDEVFYTLKFSNCYPTNLPDLDLNYEPVTSIPSFKVDFHYEDYEFIKNNNIRLTSPASEFVNKIPFISKGYGKEVEGIIKTRLLNQIIIDLLGGVINSGTAYFKNFREDISVIKDQIKDNNLKLQIDKVASLADNPTYIEKIISENNLAQLLNGKTSPDDELYVESIVDSNLT